MLEYGHPIQSTAVPRCEQRIVVSSQISWSPGYGAGTIHVNYNPSMTTTDLHTHVANRLGVPEELRPHLEIVQESQPLVIECSARPLLNAMSLMTGQVGGSPYTLAESNVVVHTRPDESNVLLMPPQDGLPPYAYALGPRVLPRDEQTLDSLFILGGTKLVARFGTFASVEDLNGVIVCKKSPNDIWEPTFFTFDEGAPAGTQTIEQLMQGKDSFNVGDVRYPMLLVGPFRERVHPRRHLEWRKLDDARRMGFHESAGAFYLVDLKDYEERQCFGHAQWLRDNYRVKITLNFEVAGTTRRSVEVVMNLFDTVDDLFAIVRRTKEEDRALRGPVRVMHMGSRLQIRSSTLYEAGLINNSTVQCVRVTCPRTTQFLSRGAHRESFSTTVNFSFHRNGQKVTLKYELQGGTITVADATELPLEVDCMREVQQMPPDAQARLAMKALVNERKRPRDDVAASDDDLDDDDSDDDDSAGECECFDDDDSDDDDSAGE